MKVGIAVDDYKLPVYRKGITEAGFAYEDGGALTGSATLLTVITDDIEGLKRTVLACHQACREKRT